MVTSVEAASVFGAFIPPSLPEILVRDPPDAAVSQQGWCSFPQVYRTTCKHMTVSKQGRFVHLPAGFKNSSLKTDRRLPCQLGEPLNTWHVLTQRWAISALARGAEGTKHCTTSRRGVPRKVSRSQPLTALNEDGRPDRGRVTRT